MLRCKLFVGVVIIRTLGEHIVDQTDREQIQVADTDAQLDTPEHEQRRCHFQTVKEIERCRLFTYVRFLEVLGDASLWGYLLHMKILFVLENHMDVTIIVYVLITCTLTIVLNEIIKYMRVIGKSDMLKL